MTWDVERNRFGSNPCNVVEIDFDLCQNVYGISPCTATEANKCYNTFKTCRDKTNFIKIIKTYRFSDILLDPDADSFPSLISVKTSPTRIDPAKGLGVRASVTIQIMDHTHSDSGIDPYLSTRTYDPSTQGTFWGRLIARNRYYIGRPIRIITGYLVNGIYDEDNFKISHFVIERIEGPDSKGIVTVTAKDPLKLADDERTQVPAVTKGLLTSDITSGSSTFTVTATTGSAYGSSGTVQIDDEMINYTRSTDTFTIASRAVYGTVSADHDTGGKVQECAVFDDVDAIDIIYTILTDYAGIDVSLIDLTAWTAESDVWMANAQMNVIIGTPEGATSVVNSIAQQAGCYLWWDEREQLIQLKAIRPATWGEVHTLNDDENILDSTTKVTEKPDERISQVWVYYGKTSPVLDDKAENYRTVYVKVDADAETAFEYGQSKVKVIFCPYIPESNTAQPQAIANQYLDKFRDNPRYLTIQLDAKDADVWAGTPVQLTSRLVQSITGAYQTLNMLVIEAKEIKAGSRYELILAESYFQGRYCYIMRDDALDFEEATIEDRNTGGFICDTATELMSDSSDPYKIV